MTLLLASIAALVTGPLAYRFAHRSGTALTILDGFVFVAISGLVILSVLPEAIVHGGWIAIVFIVAGFVGPTVAEHLFHRAAKGTHVAALILGLVGLFLHAFVDGAALGDGLALQAGGQLPTAVVLHRLPVGLAIWWLLRPHFGTVMASLALTAVAGATTVGYYVGPALGAEIAVGSVAWFQAFVGGSLLHVVFFRPHLDAHTHGKTATTAASRRSEGVGALIALALLAVILRGAEAANAGLQGKVIGMLTELSLESAPALLLAFLAAGFISVFMPPSSIEWLARGGTGMQAVRGVAFGLPLPICSCGVVPLYRSLIGKGVPPAAAIAFLVATPELGLDAVFLSIPLLGPHMTAIRVVGATVVALLVGRLVGSVISSHQSEAPVTDTDSAPVGDRLRARVNKAFRVGLGDVVDDTAPWILAGLGVAALAAPFLDGAPLSAIPAGVDVLIFALLGVPTYVCASAATPLVAVLLLAGLSPGAALAFLITGPATNITTFGVLTQLHGKRAAVTFSMAIIGTSVALGYSVNAFFGNIPIVALDMLTVEGASAYKIAALIGLVLLFSASLLRRGPRGFVAELTFSGG